MEAYPPDYVQHNLPLILLSGLATSHESNAVSADNSRTLLEGGFRIRSDAPPLTGATAEVLSQIFLATGSSDQEADRRSAAGDHQGGRYKIRSIGRVGQKPFIGRPSRDVPQELMRDCQTDGQS